MPGQGDGAPHHLTDVLGCVLSNGGDLDLKMDLRCVSRSCREAVDHATTGLRLDVANLIHRPQEGGLPLSFPALRVLKVQRARPSDSRSGLLHLAAAHGRLLRRVQHLNLSQCEGLQADVLSALLAAAPNLHTLLLPPAASCSAARTPCDLHNPPAPSSTAGSCAPPPSGLLLALRGCPQLRSLGGGAGDHLSPPGAVDHLAQLTRLTHLHLEFGCRASACMERRRMHAWTEQLAPLTALTALRRLTLPAALVGRELCALVARLPSLERLDCAGDPGTAGGWPSAPRSAAPLSERELAPLAALPRLRHLGLGQWACMVDDALAAALGACAALTSLQVQGASASLTPRGAAHLRRLQSLELSPPLGGEEAAAAALLHLPQLEALSLTLHVRGAPGSLAGGRRDGLLAALARLPRLAALRLACYQRPLYASEVGALPAALPALRALHVTGHLEDRALGALARAAPGLVRLSLTGNEELTPGGLAALAGSCPRLRHVRVERVRGLDARALSALAAAPRVERVELLGCRHVGAAEAAAAQAAAGRAPLSVARLRYG